MSGRRCIPRALLLCLLAAALGPGAQAASAAPGGYWALTGVLVEGRGQHTMTQLPSGKVLAAGSSLDAGANESRSSAELYDPLAGPLLDPLTGTPTGAWTATASMNVQREDHTATLLQNGKVLVVGGAIGPEANSTMSPPFGPQASTELYDPGSGTWRSASPLSCTTPNPPNADCPGPLIQRRSDHRAVLLPSGKVLVAGGHDGANTGCMTCAFEVIPLSSAELYDPATGTWSSCSASGTPGPNCPGAMGTARNNGTLTLLESGKVLAAGGQPSSFGLPLASAEIYDPATGIWTPTANAMTQSRRFHAATLLADGRVLLTGGSGNVGVRATTEIYDPATDRFSAGEPLRRTRRDHNATLLPSGNVLISGGDGFDAGTETTSEIYEPTANGGKGRSVDVEGTEFGHDDVPAVLLGGAGCGPNCGKVLLAGGFPLGGTPGFFGNRTSELFTERSTPDPAPGGGGGGGSPRPPSPAPGSPSSSFPGCPALTANVIRGTASANSLRGTARADRIFAAGGDDRVTALDGADCVDLGAGTDRGSGGSGADLLLGNAGADRIGGGSGRDRISGGAGNDRLSGNSGNDSITGGSGRDRLNGGSGADRIVSGAASDVISARDGRRDRINCGRGRDRVVADARDRVSRNCERVSRRGGK